MLDLLYSVYFDIDRWNRILPTKGLSEDRACMDYALALYHPFLAKHKDSPLSADRVIEKYDSTLVAQCCTLVFTYPAGETDDALTRVAVVAMMEVFNRHEPIRRSFVDGGVYSAYIQRLWPIIQTTDDMAKLSELRTWLGYTIEYAIDFPQ